jgi:hypothetical protein
MRFVRLISYLLVFGSAAAGVATAAPHEIAPAGSPVKAPATAIHRLAPQRSVHPKDGDGHKGAAGLTRLTGLPNAIAHVQNNLSLHPNKGLQNALDHLQANDAKHAAKGQGSSKKG